jgi:hypothetical protein
MVYSPLTVFWNIRLNIFLIGVQINVSLGSIFKFSKLEVSRFSETAISASYQSLYLVSFAIVAQNLTSNFLSNFLSFSCISLISSDPLSPKSQLNPKLLSPSSFPSLHYTRCA